MTFPVQPQAIDTMPGGKVGAQVLQGLLRVRNLAEEKIAWYTERVTERPAFLDGIWRIGPGKMIGKISNADEASKALVQAGALTPVEVTDCTTLSAAKLRDKIAADRNIPKLAAKNILDTHLGELITYTTTAGSLVKTHEKQIETI